MSLDALIFRTNILNSTGEVIQVVRRMSKKKEPDTLEELVERVRTAVFREDDPAFLAVQELQRIFAALTSD